MEIVFLPIKPKYVNRILLGDKKWEYRKAIPKRQFQALVIYSSSPEKRIRAFAQVDTIVSGTPAEVWEKTQRFSGIEKDEFFAYFINSKVAYAIKLGEITPLSGITPIDLDIKIPQSFAYLSANKNEKIQECCQIRFFVGGIHGSGKTSLCKEFISAHDDFEHISSSAVINYAGLRGMVTGARKNQSRLVDGIERYPLDKSNMIIDGHYALMGKSSVQKISTEVFRKLKISAFGLLLSDPHTSSSRIRNRDGENIPSEALTRLQMAELENAMQIARRLDTPIIISNSQSEIIDRLSNLAAKINAAPKSLL